MELPHRGSDGLNSTHPREGIEMVAEKWTGWAALEPELKPIGLCPIPFTYKDHPMNNSFSSSWYEVQYFGAKGWTRWDREFEYSKDGIGADRTSARASANRTAKNLTDLGGPTAVLKVRVIHCTVHKDYSEGN
jgi:hypothetical protein